MGTSSASSASNDTIKICTVIENDCIHEMSGTDLLHASTPTIEAGYHACIQCLAKYAHLVEDFTPKKKSCPSSRESAEKWVFLEISHGKQTTQQKFAAIEWCILRGWHPPNVGLLGGNLPDMSIYTYTWDWTVEQVTWLTIHGILPCLGSIKFMVSDGKFAQLNAILQSIPETFSSHDTPVSTNFLIQKIDVIVKTHEILSDLIGSTDMSNLIMQFSDDAVTEDTRPLSHFDWCPNCIC